MVSCPTCDIEYSNKRGLVRYHFYDNPDHAPESWICCVSCNKVFEELSDMRVHHKRGHGESIAHTEMCEECGDKFRAKPSHNESYCSIECSAKGRTKWERRICPKCNGIFKVTPSQTNIYCSKSCAGKARRDRLTVDCAECGNAVTKKRQRIERVDTVYCNEQCWRSAIENDSFRDSQDEKKFRESVFKRDNYTCQDCDKYGSTLNAHHIKRVSEYPDLAAEPSNGVTLCPECHADRHENAGEIKSARLIRARYEL